MGHPTECDLNWFRGTEAELYAFANVKPKEPVVYTVKSGDTFKSVGEKYKITVDELLSANPDLLKEGAKLFIPVPTISKPVVTDYRTTNNAASSTRKHTVKQGDTLGSIASTIWRDRGCDQSHQPEFDESESDLCGTSDRHSVVFSKINIPVTLHSTGMFDSVF